MQVRHHHTSDPARRFLSLVQMALASGQAHLSDRSGCVPESPKCWGWRRKQTRGWFPSGSRIGRIKASDVFLDPEVSYKVAQQMAGAERFPISAQTLRHHLRKHGLLASVDGGREMLLVRRTAEGRPRQVLHLRSSDLVPAKLGSS